MSKTRRNLLIPDELWAALQRYAAKLGVKEGKPVTTSEAARRILESALSRKEKG